MILTSTPSCVPKRPPLLNQMTRAAVAASPRRSLIQSMHYWSSKVASLHAKEKALPSTMVSLLSIWSWRNRFPASSTSCCLGSGTTSYLICWFAAFNSVVRKSLNQWWLFTMRLFQIVYTLAQFDLLFHFLLDRTFGINVDLSSFVTCKWAVISTPRPNESEVWMPRLKMLDHSDEHDVCFSFSLWLL
jgi:hypothetical protein